MWLGLLSDRNNVFVGSSERFWCQRWVWFRDIFKLLLWSFWRLARSDLLSEWINIVVGCSGGLRQLDPVHTPTSYFWKIHLNIILNIYTSVSQVVSFLQVSPPNPCIHLSPPHTLYIPSPSHSPFYHLNNTEWAVQIIKQYRSFSSTDHLAVQIIKHLIK